MYFKKAEGKRVYLSPMCTDDALKYAKWMNDFEVTDKINASTNLVTVESEREWLEKNSETLSGKVIRLAAREDIDIPVEEHLIVELYSK